MTEQNNSDMASRLRKRAEDAKRNPTKSLIDKVIAERRVILDLRGDGYSAKQIAEWLANEGIHLDAGTLRNYIARICAAERQAHHDGISDPDDADIIRNCRALERAKVTRLKAHKSPPPPSPIGPYRDLAPRHSPTPSATPRSFVPHIPRSDSDL
jgi:hypothetical protein